MIITRFAPSPTGDPHIGNVRSALFAYLFAKKNKGQFLLRLEDTDRERYVEGSLQTIKDALTWLKIKPDNFDNPMIQSERLPIYKKAAMELVENGHAYVCNCSKERLEKLREQLKAKGLPPRYDGHCRKLNLPYSDDCVIRLMVPETGKTIFKDLVRGEVSFENAGLDDQVLLKSDGFPTYHLASVIDDHEMKTTHIIRVEEWLPSTPKHILLYRAFGWTPPEFAHLSIILAPDHHKLSKRHGATSILEYRKMGYLPEALINFMALLGWNSKTPRQALGKPENEFFTLADLEQVFDLANVNKAAAVFDLDKLNHFNHHYLMEKPASEILPLLDEKIVAKLSGDKEKIIEIAKDRMIKLTDFADLVSYFVEAPKIDKDKLVFRKSTPEKTRLALETAEKQLGVLDSWNALKVKEVLEKIVSESDLEPGDVFWSMRYALSGLEKSPPPEEIAEALGREETLKRIAKASSSLPISKS